MTPQNAIAKSISYLESSAAHQSLERDAYWPKWDSPWWHMSLLWEMGLADRIPATIVEKLVQVSNARYIRFFPTAKEPLPTGADPKTDVPCHCQVGMLYQVLTACGVPVDEAVPWLRPWLLKYQLPDGGLNCDEKAYDKPSPKSSVVSTLPPLEAILFCTNRPFTPVEETFLDRGADYLIAHKLFRSADGKKIINKDWLKICFPRLYDYDLLRGLRFLTEYSAVREKTLPGSAIQETLGLLHTQGTIKVQHSMWNDPATGFTSDFELLRLVSEIGRPEPTLNQAWNKIQSGL